MLFSTKSVFQPTFYRHALQLEGHHSKKLACLEHFARPKQGCRFQATQCPVGRLQLHWERATKAIHQIPRSKTPDTVTPDSRSASLRSKVLAALSTASAWMSAYLKPGSSALFKRAVVSIAEAGFVHGADTPAMGEQPLACQRKSCISSVPCSANNQAVDKGSSCCREDTWHHRPASVQGAGRSAHSQRLDVGVLKRAPTAMTSKVPLPAFAVAPALMNRVSADFEMSSGSPVRALSSHLPTWPPKRMPSPEMVASMCALKETMSPTHLSCSAPALDFRLG